VTNEFTHTKAGAMSLDNIVEKYNCDLITFRFNPRWLKERIKKDFVESLNPTKYVEEHVYKTPIDIAKRYGIKLVFFGENASFEYGSAETLDIFHPASTDDVKIIYLGAIYSYSTIGWYEEAKSVGFIDLDDTNEWQRQGQIENFSEIGSIGYHMGAWTKFVKFGFQRVSDIACRLVRDGVYSKEQALQLIKDKDYICDPMSKRDFCITIGISEAEFDKVVDTHANRDLVEKDIDGIWRRKDLM
jgi:hypothetical protein